MRGNHRRGPRIAIAARMTSSAVVAIVIAAAAGGCAIFDPAGQTLSRSVTIHRHHFDPAEMTVPADTPFDLVVSAVDVRTVTISSPSLGFESFTVPVARRAETSLRPLTLADFEKVRIPVGPLPAGVYEFSCDCHGERPIGRLTAR
jgi:hypothetical protein